MIYIRADANKDIGMGHIMRCLSIADAAKRLNLDVLFVLADDCAVSVVKNRGYNAFVLFSDYKDMENELSRWPQEIPDSIIVDSYYVTFDYLSALRRITRVTYLDDLAACPYPVDMLVNYNIYGTSFDYRLLYNDNPPKLLIGPFWAPLRASFQKVKKKLQRRKVKDVLISTGGADSLHVALSIVKANPCEFIYHILIGALNSDRNQIVKLANSNNHIVLHEKVDNMRKLISMCDIAVSAAGSTMYEICACGVPAITFSVADNQIIGAAEFDKMGLAINLGDMRVVDSLVRSILTSISELSRDYDLRCKMANRMQEVVDGYGADRIIRQIVGEEIENQ